MRDKLFDSALLTKKIIKQAFLNILTLIVPVQIYVYTRYLECTHKHDPLYNVPERLIK